MRVPLRWDLALLFLGLLFFRTLFGLCLPFGEHPQAVLGEDARQTYLIGLRYAATADWPYYGPDIYDPNAGIHDQIPGALEGILIGLPLRIFPLPELPFLVLNTLTLGALALFAWAVVKRLPSFSFPIVFTWMALLPWNLHISTTIVNNSYPLIGSLLFFTGFLEAFPPLTTRRLSPFLAFGLMGSGVLFCMQFHASWVLLPPFLLAAFLWRRTLKGPWLPEVGGCLLGALLPFLFLLPTLLKFDPSAGSSAVGDRLASFNWSNLSSSFTILARYLSMACHEVPRFLGLHTSDRIEYLKAAPWIIPPALVLLLAGWIQPLLMLFQGLRLGPKDQALGKAGLLTAAGFLWVLLAFCFTDRAPAAHLFHILFPLPALFSFYIWDRTFPGRKGAIALWFLTACALWFQSGTLIHNLGDRPFFSHREKVLQALAQKDPSILGERRPGSLY